MARKRERLFAGFGALLFLVTSSAVTIAVVVALVQQGKSGSNNSTNTSSQTQGGNKVGQLAGTELESYTPGMAIPQLKEDDLTPGTGATVKPGATVTVDYTGAVASTGKIFQSSKDSGQPVTFPLSGVIAGWSQGIPGMKVGGTRRLLIPASLAYGANPPQGSGIPANADLVFDVTVHSTK
ncbi:MAG TPA: FKBP-type peptidyl-prolyl cis-trans isomerase [Candidatus Saccharimonadia bacterium]|nr:FKBP-type peptidyl-prolyl cis-trans isomerase [Candidatus Saccharimonadia bacterium]